MNTGDKVLAILGAKALCCGLLVLASTGALGSVFGWFLDRSVGWIVAAALVVGIAAVVWRSGAAKAHQLNQARPDGTEVTRSENLAQRPHRFR